MFDTLSTFAKVKLLTPTAQTPERGSDRAAGLDVFADLLNEDGHPSQLFNGEDHFDLDIDIGTGKPVFRLLPGCRIMVPLGIAMATSDDIYPRIAPRSGLALKNGLQILGGVVDADYRGQINAICLNSDMNKSLDIHHGMRIAQLVLEHVWLGTPTSVKSLDEQARGYGGFGSTGV